MCGVDGIQKVRHSNTYNEVSQGSDRYYHCLETGINSDRWRLKRKGPDNSKPFCSWYNMGDQKMHSTFRRRWAGLRESCRFWVQHPTGGNNHFPPEQHARVLANTAHPQGEGRRVVRCPALHLVASSTGVVPKKKKKKKKTGESLSISSQFSTIAHAETHPMVSCSGGVYTGWTRC